MLSGGVRQIPYGKSPNMTTTTVSQQLAEDQPPLGTQFKSYQLNQATNYYLLDPFQYSVTNFGSIFNILAKTDSKTKFYFQ